ncbi:MAG: hypothetical protein M0D55_07760 [Elusimicrobiota bacterium]|nr:MAG: hypothetical protein M0D55_07760 [Elusimicrobiota bacterium]
MGLAVHQHAGGDHVDEGHAPGIGEHGGLAAERRDDLRRRGNRRAEREHRHRLAEGGLESLERLALRALIGGQDGDDLLGSDGPAQRGGERGENETHSDVSHQNFQETV